MAARSIRVSSRSERCYGFCPTTRVQRPHSMPAITSSMALRRTCSIAGSDSPDGKQLPAEQSAARQFAEAFEVYVAAADDHADTPTALSCSHSSRGRQPEAAGRLDDQLHTCREETH